MTYTAWKTTSPTYRAYQVASTRCTEAFATTTYTGPAPQFSEWRHPGTGETRHYINNPAELIGLEANRYGTGNISSAILNGHHVSNTKAHELFNYLSNSKFWLTTDGKLHTRPTYGTPRAMHPDEITDAIQHAVNAHQ